jgi:hypothetical protein
VAKPHQRATLLPAILVLIAVAACDDTSSPTGPLRGSLSSGAIITGRVSGVDLTAPDRHRITPPAITRTGSDTLRVTIQGTDISTIVDGAGGFTLANVPLGMVTLIFQNHTVSASIRLLNVTAGDDITIDVFLDGTSARVVRFTGTRVEIDDTTP